MKKMRVGAINWDASLPSDTYFGFYQTNSLSQEKYREWTPFYAELLSNEKAEYRTRTPEEYEREMQYAIDAGIDYFAYVWYPEEGSKSHIQTSFNDCSHKVYELNYARRLYEKSTLKDNLGACAILGDHPFTEGDLAELVTAFREPYYEKIDGKPLLYIYGGYREKTIEKIHSMCRENGQPEPFTVPMVTTAEGAEKMPLASALSAYAVTVSGISSHDELIDGAIEANKNRFSDDLALIPTFTVGWNPTPRIERKTPWTTLPDGASIYENRSYAPRATDNELIDGARRFVQFLNDLASERLVGHILTFAWNEFEEGAYICPTYTKNKEISLSRIKAFSEISRIFKESVLQK